MAVSWLSQIARDKLPSTANAASDHLKTGPKSALSHRLTRTTWLIQIACMSRKFVTTNIQNVTFK